MMKIVKQNVIKQLQPITVIPEVTFVYIEHYLKCYFML